MPALFPPWTNTVARLSVALVLATPALGIAALMIYVRSPYGTDQSAPVAQPIQFDHRHHVADNGIDCRYCHSTVERSAFAGVPGTGTCMGCHAQIWNKSPPLALVREYYFRDLPIPWNRVHNLPDFVYFNHSAHVTRGVGCATCHGRVDQMAAVQQVAPLTMQWCFDCHRAPEQHLRPLEQITSMTYTRQSEDEGLQLKARYRVETRTNCTACHR